MLIFSAVRQKLSLGGRAIKVSIEVEKLCKIAELELLHWAARTRRVHRGVELLGTFLLHLLLREQVRQRLIGIYIYLDYVLNALNFGVVEGSFIKVATLVRIQTTIEVGRAHHGWRAMLTLLLLEAVLESRL